MVNVFTNVVCIAVIFVFYISTVVEWANDVVTPTILGYIVPHFFLAVLLPFKFCISNPEVWQHIKSCLHNKNPFI